MKIIKTLILSFIILLAAAWAAGFPPAYFYNAPSIAAGIGARLSCSMHYVLGYNEAQIAKDIKAYSPMLALLNYQFDLAKKTSSAAIGLYKRTATWIEGEGCDLDYSGVNPQSRAKYAWPKLNLEKQQQPWPLGNQVATQNPELNRKLAAILERDNQAGQDTRALLVVHKGEVVAEAYASGYNAESKFLGWSMSKSVTALLAGYLNLQGKLAVEETHLFNSWQNDERSAISLKQLLQMTDGLAYDEIYQPGYAAPAMLFQTADSTQYMTSLPLRTAPGEHYRYSSGSTNLVMALVQERFGKTPEQAINAMAQAFFEPLGLRDIVFETDSSGLLMGSSYMYASARDWAKIGQLMLNKGEINGQRFMSEDWVQSSIAPNEANNEQDFGYNWWLNSSLETPRWPSFNSGVYSSKGSREQRVFIIPEQDLVIVRLGWSTQKYPDDINFKEISEWF
ncbi:MAG: serine hydrolase [Venatoribacter sp.]